MTVDIEIISNKRIEFNGFLKLDVGIELIEVKENRNIYRWIPKGTDKYPVFLDSNKTPWRYSMGSVEDIISNAKHDDKRLGRKRKIIIPKKLGEKFNRDKDTICADEYLYRIMMTHENIDKELDFFEPVWGIVKLTKGKPSYTTNIRTRTNSPEKTIESMTKLAEFLAVKYNGIVWSGDTEKFGAPDPKELNRIYSAVKNGVTNVLEKINEIKDIKAVD